MQGNKNYQEKLFLNFQLSQRIPEDNFYRRLKKELNLGFIRKQTSKYYGKDGQKSIDPVVFFKLMLVGYIENYNSDRKIISNSCMRMDILFFLDYDIDEELPWHSTLSRTRKLYGEDLFLEVFREILSMCIKKGMINGRTQAIDSAFVSSAASMNSLIRKESESYLSELSENEDEIKDKKEEKENDEPNEQAKQRRKKQYPMSNENWKSKTDADARLAKKGYKPLSLQYNIHISVDTSSHLICGVLADYADKKDSRSMIQIMNQTKTTLLQEGISLEKVLADTGYKDFCVVYGEFVGFCGK
jgi:Transposase and inactivated derivatives